MYAESEDHTIGVARVVVVLVAIVIDVTEIRGIVHRTQPPVVGATDV